MSIFCGVCQIVLVASPSSHGPCKDLFKGFGGNVDSSIINSPCGHSFHTRCILNTKRNNGKTSPYVMTCPNCHKVFRRGEPMNYGSLSRFKESLGLGLSSESLNSTSSLPRNISRNEVFNKKNLMTQMSVDVNMNRRSKHGDDEEEDETTKDGEGIHHSVSTTSRRSYLRERIIELKELDGGIGPGSRVVCYPDQPEDGTVKWVGKINQIIYVGVEFDKPLGSDFPETGGAPPFACKDKHGRLVLRNDLLVAAEYYQGRRKSGLARPTKQKLANHALLQGRTNSNLFRSPLDQFRISRDFSAAADVLLFSSLVAGFYELCSETSGLLRSSKSRLDGLVGQKLKGDPAFLTVLLERTKYFQNELKYRKLRVEMCRNKSEQLAEYPDVLLPCEENRIMETLEELVFFYKTLKARLAQRIENLENALDCCKTILELIQDKFDCVCGAKGQMRLMETNLITHQSQLANRVIRLETLSSSFKSTEMGELAEISGKISDFLRLGGSSEEFDQKTDNLLQLRSLVIQEIRYKLDQGKEDNELFEKFNNNVTEFDLWYDAYVLKIREVILASPNQTTSDPLLVKEREEKRSEFLKLLVSAGKLRVSVFDPAVLDDKIEALQHKWRNLMESLYGNRSRKTV